MHLFALLLSIPSGRAVHCELVIHLVQVCRLLALGFKARHRVRCRARINRKHCEWLVAPSALRASSEFASSIEDTLRDTVR